MSGAADGPARATSGWLAGLLLGGLTGLTTISFVLGVLGLPIILASIAVILWKGPRAIALSGYLTGIGLLWTVAIVSSTVSCLTIDRGPGRWCEPGDVGRFLAGGVVMFAVGLLASAVAFSRLRRRVAGVQIARRRRRWRARSGAAGATPPWHSRSR